jgi:hypothetical protein
VAVSVRLGVNVSVKVGVSEGIDVRLGVSVGMAVSVPATYCAIAVWFPPLPEPQAVSRRDKTSRIHKAFIFMHLLYSSPNGSTMKTNRFQQFSK